MNFPGRTLTVLTFSLLLSDVALAQAMKGDSHAAIGVRGESNSGVNGIVGLDQGIGVKFTF